MNTIFKAFSALLIAFLLLGTSVRSAESTSYSVEKIEIDDLEVSDGSVVYVERGTTLDVSVWIRGLADADDVKVKAWIGGYEYDDVEDTSEIFDIENGVIYKETLQLEIPEDFELNNDRDTLNIEVYDSDYSLEYEFEVRIKEGRHSLNIVDVNINPGLTVEAGKNVFGTVRVENLGDRNERDVKVVMSIPELGLSAKTFIDKLVWDDPNCDSCDDDNDYEVSASSDEMYLKIPENTADGTYTLKFQVVYNRGHTVEEKTYALTVTEGKASVSTEAVSVSVDTSSQTVEAGKGVVFKVMVTNLGSKTMTFTTDVAGVASWGTSRADPATVTVAPDQSGEMYVYVSANENAASTDNAVTLTVKSGDKIIKQMPVAVKVMGSSSDATFGSLRRGLEIGFIVLLIVLVILGLILAARKLGGKDEEESGKTYY